VIFDIKSDNSNRKTRVRFAYVLPHILHGDFFYEIKYLVNPQLNILHILTSHVDNSFRYIFIYRFSYLLTYYYSFLAHYNKKCFDIN
jgi:hypothetical protein